jgi:hypothetical protein
MFPLALAAQKNQSVKPGWRMITAAGFSAGEAGTGAVFQLSGGITYKSYFAGVGMGYDKYEYKSFPLFANLQMGFGKRQLLFVYAMPGYTFRGKYSKEPGFDWRKVEEKMKGGFYADAGIGYKIPLGLHHRLAFSAGYVRKSMFHEKKYIPLCNGEPCPDTNPDFYTYRYKYGLITIKLGWEWGR